MKQSNFDTPELRAIVWGNAQKMNEAYTAPPKSDFDKAKELSPFSCPHEQTKSIEPTAHGLTMLCLQCGEKFNPYQPNEGAKAMAGKPYTNRLVPWESVGDWTPSTCATCKHYVKEFSWFECDSEDVVRMATADNSAGLAFEPPPDFGCNRWATK